MTITEKQAAVAELDRRISKAEYQLEDTEREIRSTHEPQLKKLLREMADGQRRQILRLSKAKLAVIAA